MGGRNRQTFNRNEISPSIWKDSNVTLTRNLTKNQLGGVIFGCTKSTMKECLNNQLFGLPANHFSYVKNIEPGLPLFLFDYSDRKLHGIFEAASLGKMNLDPYAWTTDGSDRTKYPAQVQIRLRLHCQALAEHQFKPIIADNYYSQTHFWFELDHGQASKLLSKLSSLAVAPRPFTPQDLPKWSAVVHGFPSNNKREERVASEPPPLTDNLSVFSDSIETPATLDNFLSLKGKNQLMESSLPNPVTELDEKDLMYVQLKELAIASEFSDANMMGGAVGAAATSHVDWGNETQDDDQETLVNGECSSHPLDCPAIVEQLSREEELKTFQQDQTQKMEILENKLAEAEQEIYQWKNRCIASESVSYTSMQPSGVHTLVESPVEFSLNLNESILILGGYDGASWSSAVHSFLPAQDILRSLKPMSSVRSFASIVRFNGELYAFGGGSGPN